MRNVASLDRARKTLLPPPAGDQPRVAMFTRGSPRKETLSGSGRQDPRKPRGCVRLYRSRVIARASAPALDAAAACLSRSRARLCPRCLSRLSRFCVPLIILDLAYAQSRLPNIHRLLILLTVCADSAAAACRKHRGCIEMRLPACFRTENDYSWRNNREDRGASRW